MIHHTARVRFPNSSASHFLDAHVLDILGEIWSRRHLPVTQIDRHNSNQHGANMANQAVQAQEPAGPVEEHYYRRGDIDFCFLLNRTHLNLRVFDYRVGNYQQKRDFFDRIARSEGLKKVFTVVEKQDSKSWRSVGFSREGARHPRLHPASGTRR